MICFQLLCVCPKYGKLCHKGTTISHAKATLGRDRYIYAYVIQASKIQIFFTISNHVEPSYETFFFQFKSVGNSFRNN